MRTERSQTIFFVTIIIVSALLSFFVFRPYIAPLFLALVLYIAVRPAHLAVLKIFGRFRTVASLVTLLLFFIIVCAPLFYFGFLLSQESHDVYFAFVTKGLDSTFLLRGQEVIDSYTKQFLPATSVDLAAYISQALGYVIDNLDSVFSRIIEITIDALIMFVALFYLLKDGGRLKETIFFLSPLPDERDADIFNHVETAVSSVVRGSLLISIIHSVWIGIGFLVFGVPNPIIFAFVTAFAALIPGGSIVAIIIPAVLYLFFNGSIISTVGLLVWGLIAIVVVDNILGPIFIGRGAQVHSFLILLSALGGIAFFGLVGFIAGPVIVSLLFALLRMYPSILASIYTSQNQPR